MLENQGLLGIAFFEATAFVILLVLFFLLRRDYETGNFRLWLAGWVCLTLSSFFEIGSLFSEDPAIRLATLAGHTAALLLFLGAVMQLTAGFRSHGWSMLPCLLYTSPSPRD